ncbi:hypothetical protein NT6N_19350 [Oceaniferula spumae]|uniref:Uncharacterized protein n=1 Tax=Oceaniferula spumae TaxID=2979115 RepID=A0AAT9FLK9_9BACT
MKTPKRKLTKHLTKTAAVALTLCLLSNVNAQRRGPVGPPRGGGGTGVTDAPVARHFDINELGSVRDKFAAYKKLNFEGAGFYTKNDRELRVAHTKTYLLIRNSLIEDRLEEDTGRNATAALMTIGQEAKKLLVDKEALSDEDAESILGKIQALAKRIEGARLNKINADTLTPKINERQVTMEEIYLFAVDRNTASKGQAATLRRHLTSLEDKESRAKTDSSVSDREREKLVEDTIDVWQAFVRVLKP